MDNALTITKTEIDLYNHAGAKANGLLVDHGIRDEKGRAVGGFAHIRKTNAVWSRETGAHLKDEAGQFIPGYEVSIHALRDGRCYGASPPTSCFRTIEEAEAYGTKGLNTQHKAYVKKYGAKAAA